MPKGTIDIHLATGIDTGATEKFVGTSSLIVSKNGTIDKKGALRKRDGYTRVPLSGENKEQMVFSHGGKLVRVAAESDSEPPKLLERTTEDGWSSPEDYYFFNPKLEIEPAGDIPNEYGHLSYAKNGSYFAVITRNSDTASRTITSEDSTFHVVDDNSGTLLSSKTFDPGTTILYRGNVEPYLDGFLFTRYDDLISETTIHYWEPVNKTFTALLTISAAADACVVEGEIFAVLRRTGNNSNIRITTHDSAGTIIGDQTYTATPANISTTTNLRATSVKLKSGEGPGSDYDYLVMTYLKDASSNNRATATAVKADGTIYTTTLPYWTSGPAGGPSGFSMVPVSEPCEASTRIYVFGGTSSITITELNSTGGSSAAGSYSFSSSTSLLGDPFACRGSLFFTAYHSPAAARVTSILSASTVSSSIKITPIAKVNPLQSTPAAISRGNAARMSDCVYAIPSGGTRICLDFNAPMFKPVRYDEYTIIPGANNQMYYRGDFSELGYNSVPTLSGGTASSGGSLGEGSYSYIAIFDYTDIEGNVHRSAQSNTLSATTTSSNKTVSVNFTVPKLDYAYSRKLELRRVRLYRTLVDGTVYYYHTDLTGTSSPYSDSTADSSIETNATLYTTGGIIEAGVAPPSLAIVNRNDRLFLAPSDDGRELWFSKPLEKNVAPEFSPFLKKFIPAGGPITGLATMDRYVVIFKRERIFVLSGQGPNSLGVGEFLDPAEVITNRVGCINPRSIVEVADGVLFQSSRGIYLLSRGLTVEYAGQPVEEFNDEFIIAAGIAPNSNQIRFHTKSGLIMVYDYDNGAWHTHQTSASKHALIDDGTHVYVNKQDQVLVEAPGVYTDDGEEYGLEVETAWLSMRSKQGYQRISWAYLLGDFEDRHDLTVKLYKDYEEEPFQVIDVSASEFTGRNGTVHQLRFKPSIQKMQTIKFRFEEKNSSGAGMTLNTLSLVLEDIPEGMAKLSSGRTR